MFDNINIDEFYDNNIKDIKKYKFSKITKKMIERVEKKLNYKLPNSYKDFLKLQNGGYINSDLNENAGISCIYGISKEENNSNSLENLNEKWINDLNLDINGVIIGESDRGEDIYYLDYKICDKKNEPIVVCMDISGRKTVVANNFSKFINNIYNGKELMHEKIEEYRKKDKKDDISDTQMFFKSCGCVIFSFVIAIIAFIASIDFLFTIGAILIVISSLIFLFSLLDSINNIIKKKKDKK